MTKYIKIFTFIFALTLFTACNSKTEQGGSGTENTEASGEAGAYTCSMHPEVVSDKPGKCPKCGMELTLKDNTETDTTSHEGHAH